MKLFALTVLAFWLIAVIVGRVISLDGNAIELTSVLANPSWQHWFGADDLGRDVLARILRGVEVSFLVAVLVTMVTMLLGVSIGLLAGFYGEKSIKS